LAVHRRRTCWWIACCDQSKYLYSAFLPAAFAFLHRALAIADSDTKTVSYRLDPQYAYEQGKAPRLTGFQATQQIALTLHGTDGVGKTLDRLVQGDAATTATVAFALIDAKAAQASARGGSVTISTRRLVNAGGPYVGRVGRLLGLEIPVFCERHAKVAFNDVLGAVPRSAAVTIWTDPIRLPWSDEERAELSASVEHRRLVDEFPGGVHGRPEGAGESPVVLLIWTYDVEPVEPKYPLEFDPAYGEICLRGMSRMIPALSPYLNRLPRVYVDGGYYTKTRENRLLSGPLPLEGAYMLGALSGYGLMSSNGAADLLADHVAGRRLPAYAPAFALSRYDDPKYRELLEQWGDSGQL